MPWPCEGFPCRLQTALQPSLLQLVTDLCGRRLMVVRRQFAILDVAYRLFQGAGEIDAVRPLPALDFELRAAIQADADSHLLDAHHDSPVSFRSVGKSLDAVTRAFAAPRTARTPPVRSRHLARCFPPR